MTAGAIWFVTGSLTTIAAVLGALLQRQVRCSPLFEAFRTLPVREPRPVTEAEMRREAAAQRLQADESEMKNAPALSYAMFLGEFGGKP